MGWFGKDVVGPRSEVMRRADLSRLIQQTDSSRRLDQYSATDLAGFFPKQRLIEITE